MSADCLNFINWVQTLVVTVSSHHGGLFTTFSDSGKCVLERFIDPLSMASLVIVSLRYKQHRWGCWLMLLLYLCFLLALGMLGIDRCLTVPMAVSKLES